MSRKVTKEVFYQRFQDRYPEAVIKILEYNGLKSSCKIKCLKCGKEIEKKRAESFLTSFPCCEGNNETKIELIKRLCEKDEGYEFIKQVDSTHVIIKHLCCGSEFKKSIQAAISAPCICSECQSQSKKLRLTKSQAQQQLDESFLGSIEVVFFDGVDSKKSQFRCKKCGLLFNQSYYNLLKKCRGCPKCDQRKSKGERAMRKYLEEKGKEYREQVRISDLGRLSFDFEIISSSGETICFIEVQCEQHYREVFKYKNRSNYFLIQQEHDQQKRDWCKKWGYPLYEIISEDGILKNLDILPF